jgi:dipeptidyl aminopeptidase/acylaminoacyl peptidase
VNLTGDRPESVTDLVWMERDRLAAVVVTGTRSALLSIDAHHPDVRRVLIAPGETAFLSATASRAGRRFAFAASTADGPPDVYAGEQGTGSAFETRRVVAANLDLQAMPRGKQEIVTYKARDGLAIEGVLIRPVGYPSRGSYPLVVIAHGGPESQYLDGWNTSYSTPGQALAERGYFVFYPNYRGSTGRGVVFAKADHRDLGGKEFTDVLDGIDVLAARFPIDTAHIGITGGSYGGYFTGLGVTRYSERFAAGASMFGISDWISFLGQSDIPVENSQVHWDLWCYDHVEICREASPVGNIRKARTPTLILQGDADPRVPKPQSDQLYAALKWKDVPVEYLVFPREKHGFRERAHQIEAFERILLWFGKYLRP